MLKMHISHAEPPEARVLNIFKEPGPRVIQEKPELPILILKDNVPLGHNSKLLMVSAASPGIK